MEEKFKAENFEVNNHRDKIKTEFCISWLLAHLQTIWQVFIHLVLYYVLRLADSLYILASAKLYKSALICINLIFK